MRELIRPALFMIARTGLFLAVVAWIVGRWWIASVVTRLPVSDGRLFCSSCCHGMLFRKVNVDHWHLGVEKTADQPRIMLVHDFMLPNQTGIDVGASIILGVRYQQWGWYSSVVVRHWLIITIFTAFNIALHIIYRKRPEVQPCEN